MLSHRMTNNPEYLSWTHMLGRCRNPNRHNFKDYGERGIKICKRWQGPEGFANFYKDMGQKPTRRHSIERKNNSRGYTPSNCVWATQKQQCNNKRTTFYVTWRGKKTPLKLACEAAGLTYIAVYMRLTRLGWSDHKALTTPIGGA